MCQNSICENCRNIGWTGCGKHVARAMKEVNPESWCTCEHLITDDNTDFNYPPQAGHGSVSNIKERPSKYRRNQMEAGSF